MPVSGKFRAPKYLKYRGDRARVYVAGKYIYLPGKFNSRESRAAYQEIVSQLVEAHVEEQSLAEPIKGDVLVVELMVAYLQHADEYYAASNQADLIRLAIRPLRELFGGNEVNEITPRKWKKVREWMIRNGQTRSGINVMMARALRMFKWGVSEELVASHTYQSLQCVEPLKRGRCGNVPEAEKKGAVSEEHINAVEQFVLPEIWAMIQVQLLTGARPGEVCALRLVDVDMKSDVWEYRPESHKNEWRTKERIIYIGPRAQLVLRPYLTANPVAHVFSSRRAMIAKWERDRATAAAPLYGKRKRRFEKVGLGGSYAERLKDFYTSDSYRRAVKRGCDRAGIPIWTPYQLRHSAGQLTRNMHGVEGVSAVLGNSIDAAQIYAERNAKLAKELARKCG